MSQAALIDRAQRAALAHRMAFEPAGTDPASGEPLARIWCARCGWLADGYVAVAARYAAEPFGCAVCREAEDARAEARGRIAEAAVAAGSRRPGRRSRRHA